MTTKRDYLGTLRTNVRVLALEIERLMASPEVEDSVATKSDIADVETQIKEHVKVARGWSVGLANAR